MGVWVLELQHPIISIFGSRFSKIYFPGILFSRGHNYIKPRNLIHIQAGEGSWLVVHNWKFQPQGS